MIAKYKVIISVAVRDATLVLAGVLEGEVPDIGSIGVCSSHDTGLSFEVLGIGVVDPNIVEPGRHSLLVKIISGDEKDLEGSTFEFSCAEKTE